MSITYPTGQRPRTDRALETIEPILREAGLIDPQNGTVSVDVREIAAALNMGLRQLSSTDPWCEPFALVIRGDWCSIDGTEPGYLQMRVTPNGVQLRERTPSTIACMSEDHFVQDCENCWTVQVLHPASQWHPISERVQIRIDSTNGVTCRIEIRRRVNTNTVLPETVWSEPWQVPDYTSTDFYKTHRDDRDIDTTWVDVASDVQISTGHTFPRGILVRQATGRENSPWTTPAFLPATHWGWADLLPDGSIQFRCWNTREEERAFGRYRVEVRQQIERKPSFAVEPTWSQSKGSYGERATTTNGYTLAFTYQTHSYSYRRSITGLRVTDPFGRSHDILVTDRWVRAAPDLLINASFQGSFSWKNATSENETIRWSSPEERLLRTSEWTMLNDTVRARVTRGHRGVMVETLRSAPVRPHWWSRQSWWQSSGNLSFGTTHHLGDTLRVAFRPDQVAEIQVVTSTISD